MEGIEKTDKIALFKGKKIRKVIFEKEWWFSVVDICSVLVESADAGAYWRKLRQRLKKEGSEAVTVCHGLIDCRSISLCILFCSNNAM